ncbi:butyrophilin subfamily 1 member A1-like [Bufo gargarizans]|uniref:butyrophilin subfamily 1 member A1-like n=1 Tax=Bufo gargarizans TaxID=30331 RepID=UPI001CF376CC|nr:butyrophilin subfamily 1 member A1-like [Bufo gargarizans]
MLPCRFSFAEALTGLSVIWNKTKNDRKLILYKIMNSEEKPEEQDPQYRGRVELSTEFPQGNLHLILRNVTYEDEGTYYCRAANTKGHGDRKVTLSIDTLNADEPTVTLVTIGEKRRMKCRSSGVYHVPQVQWITAQGEDLSSYGRLRITEQSNGWRLVESVLDYDVERNKQVLCHIQEGRLRRSTRAVISDGTHPVSVDKI